MILLELAKQIGLEPEKVASTDGGEYKCPCPKCGGRKRFIIHPNKRKKNCIGSYWCRDCAAHGDTITFCREFLGLSFEDAAKRAQATLPDKSNFFPLLLSRRQESLFKSVEKPPALWVEKAALFVKWASENIFEQKDQLSWLANRGIPVEAVMKYRIGWNPKYFWIEKCEWGISEDINEKCSSKGKFTLHKGIVIPTFENADPVRIKVRNTDYDPQNENSKKYLAVAGSMKGLNLVGNAKNNIMLVVESELDALALDHVCGDFAFAVSIGSNTKNPDSFTNYLARRVESLLICHDNDEGGMAMWEKWKKLYPHARPYPTPIGKDIGEAVIAGLNLRKWVKKALSL